jgi:hypothetical protein
MSIKTSRVARGPRRRPDGSRRHTLGAAAGSREENESSKGVSEAC